MIFPYWAHCPFIEWWLVSSFYILTGCHFINTQSMGDIHSNPVGAHVRDSILKRSIWASDACKSPALELIHLGPASTPSQAAFPWDSLALKVKHAALDHAKSNVRPKGGGDSSVFGPKTMELGVRTPEALHPGTSSTVVIPVVIFFLIGRIHLKGSWKWNSSVLQKKDILLKSSTHGVCSADCPRAGGQ